MALTYTITKPAHFTNRVDDVRALRFRVRRFTPTGTYVTGGDAFTAKDVGLKRVLGAIVLHGASLTTANAVNDLPIVVPTSTGLGFSIKYLESAAAGTSPSEKGNGDATIAGTFVDLLILGY